MSDRLRISRRRIAHARIGKAKVGHNPSSENGIMMRGPRIAFRFKSDTNERWQHTHRVDRYGWKTLIEQLLRTCFRPGFMTPEPEHFNSLQIWTTNS